ncbi:MAG: trypsin-like peptidase domain-containing protein [Pseudomonadota bacterium]
MTGIASFEHLTGHSRGTTTWLRNDVIEVVLGPNAMLRVQSPETPAREGDAIAQLRREQDNYHIEAAGKETLWINGHPVTEQMLRHGDMIEFGERGPVSRYSVYHEQDHMQRGVGTVMKDAAGYLRVSRKPLLVRLFRAGCQIAWRLTRETTILFRLSVVIAFAVLATLAYKQYQVNQLLQRELEKGASQLDAFAKSLAQTQETALTPSDLEALRLELNPSVEAHEKRLAELEKRWAAGRRAIAQSSASVIFLQGSYGFKDEASGRMLRHVVTPSGRPVMTRFGTPRLSLDGTGPVATRQLTGTGFVVKNTGIIVTNRHVAMPWEKAADTKSLQSAGMAPVMTRFEGYFPGMTEPVGVSLLRASETADLALIKSADQGQMPEGLGLALAAREPAPGDQVIILGYPTGLRSMLARAGEAFVRRLQAAKISGFWDIAAALAREGRIRPLASQGIVGQIAPETIVYDAQTTHGGSGGPVLNAAGEVLAVNSAIVPKFGGSNLGVPVSSVLELLASEGIEVKPGT